MRKLENNEFIEKISVLQGPLRRFLQGLCEGDSFLADDIAQDTMLKAYLSFSRYEGRAKFSTWLFRIGWNCWYDTMNKGKKQEKVTTDTISLDFVSEDDFDKKYKYQSLYQALARLGTEEKAVTLLYYMEEKSIKEISLILEMPAGTVKSHLSRARKHLKTFLESSRLK